jgi:hypothetical protein
MPELDFALVADYVRTEGGIAHAVGAGIDTVFAAEVPTGQNIGILIRLKFTRQECDRPHRLEVIFQDVDGGRLAGLTTVITPTWSPELPVGWRQSVIGGFNVGIPLPDYGLYAFEILVNDNMVKSIPIRLIAPPEPAPPGP